ncbi:MAG TPA: hypothetical protein VF331_20525 [Polyangiales bacterium]
MFVSPDEQEATADQLMVMALGLGANHLVMHADPILDYWFRQYGFEPAGQVPKEVTQAGDGDLVYMIRSEQALEQLAPTAEPGARPCRPHDECLRCGVPVTEEVRGHESIGGYGCRRCGCISVYGMLTLEPRIALLASPETTRVTWGMYLDGRGEQTIEVAGWVGVMPHLHRHFEEHGIEPWAILGQLFVERPYRTLADAPDQFTIAHLYSLDGNKRLLQELVGHIRNPNEIRRILAQRLGRGLASWEIRTVSYMVRGANE